MKTTLLLLSSLMISLVSLGQTDTWRQITVPTNENLYCIDFPSIDVGYIGGNTGVLLKTIDSGIVSQYEKTIFIGEKNIDILN